MLLDNKNIIFFLDLKKSNIWFKLKFRNFKINYFMIDKRVAIYNGKYYIPIGIRKNMLNYNMNCFVFSKVLDIKKFKWKRWRRSWKKGNKKWVI